MKRKLLYAVAAILLGIITGLTFEYRGYVAREAQLANAQAQQTMDALKADILTLLGKMEDEAQSIAAVFETTNLSVDDVKQVIKDRAQAIPEMRGITACYEPFAINAEQRLFCPFYTKSTGDYVFVEDSYDYSAGGDDTAWYTGPRETGAQWTDPYYGAAAQAWFIDYGVPFYYRSGPKVGEFRGIIDLSLEVGDFRKLVHNLVVGKTGYGFITSPTDGFISHPINDYIGKKSLNDLIKDPATPEDFLPVYRALNAGESGSQEFTDPISGETALVYYGQIGGKANWGYALVFLKSDLESPKQQLDQRKINLAMAISAFIVVLIALYFSRDVLDRREIDQLSWLTTTLLLGNIFYIGMLEHSTSIARPAKASAPIVDLSSLGTFVGQRETAAQTAGRSAPTLVPTGVYVERLEFIDSHNVNVGGKVWQRYPLAQAEDVSIGFTFPQLSPFAESSLVEETYRERIEPRVDEPGYLLVGYDFRVTLLLDFQYLDYPFDKRHIDIEIAPLARQDNLLFTPDIESYAFTNPPRKPGLDSGIQVAGNEVLETYFNYSAKTYGTDFGLGVNGLFEDVPILHYNIHLRRVLLNAFVTSLIPIFVTLCFIYILISACEKSNERQGIIESMAAFFFVLVFSHIDLRKDIVTDELIFMEYFYFITYLLALLSTFNLMTYTKSRSPIFDYNDNQLYRAAYFPIFLALVLVVMLWKFY